MTAITAKKKTSEPCRWYVGTSGFSCTEWVEAGFYPSGTKSGKMLSLYARNFSITELNYNHVRAQASENARRMKELSNEQRLTVA